MKGLTRADRPATPPRLLLPLNLIRATILLCAIANIAAGLYTIVELRPATKHIRAATGGILKIPGGAEVRIPPGALAENATISAAPLRRAPSLPGATLAGAPIKIELSGATLRTPAELEMPLDDAIDLSPDGIEAVFVASYDQAGQRWTAQRGVIDARSRTITVEVGHFSFWSPFRWAWDKVKNVALDVVREFWKDIGEWSGPPPRCRPVSRDWRILTAEAPIKACIEASQMDQLHPSTVRLSNRRRYPLMLRLSHLGEPRVLKPAAADVDSPNELAWRELGRAFPGLTLVPGKGSLTVGLAHTSDGQDVGFTKIHVVSHLPAVMTDLMIRAALKGASAKVQVAAKAGECVFSALVNRDEPSIASIYRVIRDCVQVLASGGTPFKMVEIMRDSMTDGLDLADFIVRPKPQTYAEIERLYPEAPVSVPVTEVPPTPPTSSTSSTAGVAPGFARFTYTASQKNGFITSTASGTFDMSVMPEVVRDGSLSTVTFRMVETIGHTADADRFPSATCATDPSPPRGDGEALKGRFRLMKQGLGDPLNPVSVESLGVPLPQTVVVTFSETKIDSCRFAFVSNWAGSVDLPALEVGKYLLIPEDVVSRPKNLAATVAGSFPVLTVRK